MSDSSDVSGHSRRSRGVYVENWLLPDGSKPVTAIGPDGRMQAFYAMQPEDDEATVKRCMERLLSSRQRQRSIELV